MNPKSYGSGTEGPEPSYLGSGLRKSQASGNQPSRRKSIVKGRETTWN